MQHSNNVKVRTVQYLQQKAAFFKSKQLRTRILWRSNFIIRSRKCVDVIYFDFAKALDSVPHERLLLYVAGQQPWRKIKIKIIFIKINSCNIVKLFDNLLFIFYSEPNIHFHTICSVRVGLPRLPKKLGLVLPVSLSGGGLLKRGFIEEWSNQGGDSERQSIPDRTENAARKRPMFKLIKTTKHKTRTIIQILSFNYKNIVFHFFQE